MSSDNTQLDSATALWLVLSPVAKELIRLSRDSIVVERRFFELAGSLTPTDKAFLLPYLKAKRAQCFKNALERERREKLEQLNTHRAPSVPQSFPNDPHNDMTRQELLDRIMNTLENRPEFEGNKPLGQRLGVWLKSLEDQVERESPEFGDYA